MTQFDGERRYDHHDDRARRRRWIIMRNKQWWTVKNHHNRKTWFNGKGTIDRESRKTWRQFAWYGHAILFNQLVNVIWNREADGTMGRHGQ